MSTRRPTGHSDVEINSRVPVLGSLSRYDVLLAVIPLGFACALLVALVFDISVQQAVATGAVIGAIALADALYFNPPQGDDPRR